MSRPQTGSQLDGREEYRRRAKSTTLRMPDDEHIETLVTLPPDGGWGWIIVFCSFCLNFIIDASGYSLGVMMDGMIVSLNADKQSISLSMSILSTICNAVGPVASGFVNRYGFRSITIVSGIIAASGFVGMGFVDRIELLYVTHGILAGAGLGTLYMTSLISVGFYFEKWRAIATGISVTGAGVGVICAPIFINYLISLHGWKFACQCLGIAILGTSFVAGLFMRPLKPTLVVQTLDNKKMTMYQSRLALPGGKKQTEDIDRRTSRVFGAGNQHYITNKDFQNNTKSTLALIRDLPEQTASSSSSDSNYGVHGRGLHTLNEEETHDRRHRRRRCRRRFCGCCCFCCVRYRRRQRRKKYGSGASRPMYRDDIFYGASLHGLAQYREHVVDDDPRSRTKSLVDYHLAVSRAALARDVGDHCCSCCTGHGPMCADAVCRTLATMLDLSLLKSPAFCLFSLSCFTTAMGMYSVFIFIIDRGKQSGMTMDNAVLLLSVVGGANTAGRLLSSVLSTIPNVKALMVTYISLSICGISTLLSVFYQGEKQQFAYAVAFGSTIACVYSLRVVIVVDMCGLEKLTNAFGLVQLFTGIGSFSGTPLIGKLADQYGYDTAFLVSGSCILASAVMLMPIKSISNWERRRAGDEFTGFGFDRENIQ